MPRIISFLIIWILGLSALMGQTDAYYKFVENKGQWPVDVISAVDLEAGKLFIERDRLRFHFYDLSAIAEVHNKCLTPVPGSARAKGHVYDVVFLKSNKNALVRKSEQQKAQFNYFLGNDPQQWGGGCRSYAEISRENIYPNVDVRFHSNDFFLKYDFIVHPGGDAKSIRMKYEGAEKVQLDHGRIKVTTSVNDIWEQSPLAWQMIDGQKVPVECSFGLYGKEVYFDFPHGYDESEDLVIDPELIFSSYSGSFSDNFGYTATYDSYGYLYSGSSAFGQGYPTTTGAYQTVWGGGDGSFGLAGTDMALSKYDVSGTYMVWSTFLGGLNDELPHSLICNEDDELLVYGSTSSTNFPVTSGAYDAIFSGGTAFAPQGVGTDYVNGSDIVVARLSFDGSQLVNSTFVGGLANDGVNTASTLKFNYADEFRGEIDIDNQGNIVVASSTFSTNFPTVNAPQPSNGGGQDACVFKLSPDLSTMIFSTYLGGAVDDSGYSVAFNDANQVFVCGGTKSIAFPVTPGVIHPTAPGGTADGWVARLSANGSTIEASTYFGSTQYDQLYFVDTDAAGDVFVYGQTRAADSEMVLNALWSQANSGMVVAQLSPDLDNVIWSTVFGSGEGKPNLSPASFLVDVCGKIYLSGWGGGPNVQVNAQLDDTNGMYITGDAYQSTTDGADFYLLVLESDASAVVYASFFGGAISHEHVDGGTSRFDRRGVIYQSVCAGCGSNDDFPIFPSNAVSPTNNSDNCNNGVFKFDFQLPITVADFLVAPVGCVLQGITPQSTSVNAQTFEWDFGDNTGIQAGPNPTHTYAAAGTYDITLVVSHPGTCNVTDTLTRQVEITAPLVQQLTSVQSCQGDAVIIGPDNPNPFYTYQWVPSNFLSNGTDPNPLFTPGTSLTYQLLATHGSCTDTLYQTVDVGFATIELPNDTTLCDQAILNLTAVYGPPGANIVWSDHSDFSNIINNGPNDPSIAVNVNLPTTFYAQVTSGNCSVTDEVFVNLVSFQTSIQGDFTTCVGDTVQLSIEDPNAAFSYTWFPTSLIVSGQNTPTIDVVVDQSQMFYVQSATPDNCVAQDSVLVSVSLLNTTLIEATAQPSSIIEGGSSQLMATPQGFQYSWSPSSTLSSSAIYNPLATPSESTTYTVNVQDGDCQGSAQVRVKVIDFVCGAPSVYVPNAFTPNADGKNEKLFVHGNNMEKMYFVIYDRWGEVMFETHSLNDGWDGTFKGRAVDPAVYVYYLEYTCTGGFEYFDKGNITVIR